MPLSFKLDDVREVPPIVFDLETPDGTKHTFRATRRPSTKVIQSWLAVRIGSDGQRSYHVATLIDALHELVLSREWVPTYKDDDGELVVGHYEPADDHDRFFALVNAPESDYRLSHPQLAMLVMGILDEATGNPTGEPSSS